MARVELPARATTALGTYLRCTPIAWAAADLLEGRRTAWHDRIATRTDLGATKTFFGNLGNMYARELHGREKFLVSDVWHALGRLDCTALDDRAAVNDLIEAERAGRLVDRTITLLEERRSLMIVDGNKRAVAIYEANVALMPLSVIVLVSM